MTSDNRTSTSIDRVFGVDVSRALVPILLALAVSASLGSAGDSDSWTTQH